MISQMLRRALLPATPLVHAVSRTAFRDLIHDMVTTFPRIKHLWWFVPGQPDHSLANIRPPLSSRINRENREEILKRYQVLERQKLEGYPNNWYPFVFFNKDQDMIRGSSFTLCQDLELQFWEQYFLGDYLSFMDSVAVLEMSHGLWHRNAENCFED
jgi:hypothetical protein